MRVHHLDCCTMCPRGQRVVNGEGSIVARARLVSHCLLIETDVHGLVLVAPASGLTTCATLAGLARCSLVRWRSTGP